MKTTPNDSTSVVHPMGESSESDNDEEEINHYENQESVRSYSKFYTTNSVF